MRRGVAGGGNLQCFEVRLSQVLARKYRPRTFDQMVGQEHVAKALRHALENNRLHHAYLFVGTRGVGKTSIARILARCLNCETGITATPCLSCSACSDIEAGRFVDLIEVDAASKTKVEDTRELLENLQYAPSTGRYKVYLIDEVHMLSTSSFNALLKSLEEPPAHAIFLLATTEPQKLLPTVLSRCLQFRLRNVPSEQIAQHLGRVLSDEAVSFEPASLDVIARAAQGSLRDAMTLTDQALAFSQGQLATALVTEMLGLQGQDQIPALLEALASGEASAVMDWVSQVAPLGVDWEALLVELQRALHGQATAELRGESPLFAPEVIQLNYSLATQARTELPLAPEKQLGFEMMLLRMLAFRPAQAGEYPQQARQEAPPSPKPEPAKPAPLSSPEPAPIPAPPEKAPAKPDAELTPAPAVDLPWETAPAESQSPAQPAAHTAPAHTPETWCDWLTRAEIRGLALNALLKTEIASFVEGVLTLRLPSEERGLLRTDHLQEAAEKLSQAGDRVTALKLVEGPVAQSPASILQARAQAAHEAAVASLEAEPAVRFLSDHFGGSVLPETVKPRS